MIPGHPSRGNQNQPPPHFGWIILSRFVYIYTHTQEHLKGFEYNEKVQYFLSLISESETHILYRFITHRV